MLIIKKKRLKNYNLKEELKKRIIASGKLKDLNQTVMMEFFIFIDEARIQWKKLR